MRSRTVLMLLLAFVVAGCGNSRKSSLLLERQAVGPIEEGQFLAQSKSWGLTPEQHSSDQGGVKVDVKYASPEFLAEFFSNKENFGDWAGPSPFYSENIVFYVTISNNSNERVYFNADEFVLVDDRKNQYSRIGIDHINAFSDFKSPVSTVRKVVKDARPGFYGLNIPVGQILSKKSQKPFVLMIQSLMKSGWIYPGVSYDGLVVYWNPNVNAKDFKLHLVNIKTKFNADDEATAKADFVFDFSAKE